MRDKRAYDRQYRAANRERERPRRRAYDKTPIRHVSRVAASTRRYRVRAIERMRRLLVAS